MADTASVIKQLRRRVRAVLQALQDGWSRLQLGVWLLLCPALAAAAINTDSDQILTDMQGFIRQARTMLVYVILVAGCVTAVCMIIHGAMKMMEGKEGGLAKFVTALLVVMVTIIVSAIL